MAVLYHNQSNTAFLCIMTNLTDASYIDIYLTTASCTQLNQWIYFEALKKHAAQPPAGWSEQSKHDGYSWRLCKIKDGDGQVRWTWEHHSWVYLLCFLIEVLWSWEMLNMVQTAAGNRICCPWNRRSILNYQSRNLTTKCTSNKGRYIERGVPSTDLAISLEAISTPVVQQISQPCACFQL